MARFPMRRHGLLLVSLWLAVGGCSAVHVRDVRPERVATAQRADVLTGGGLSAATREALLVLGLDADDCARSPAACVVSIERTRDLGDEPRLAALAELELADALAADRAQPHARHGAAVADVLERYADVARSSYAYLFFTRRDPGERAFEDRQTQVRDFYNFATERFAQLLFEQRSDFAASRPAADSAPELGELDLGRWRVRLGVIELLLPQPAIAKTARTEMPGGETLPDGIVPASRLRFDGIRSTYRRDGFGAAFVAVGAEPAAESNRAAERKPPPAAKRADEPRRSFALAPAARRGADEPESPLVESRFLAATVLLRFPGETLREVLAADTAILAVHDPYRAASVEIGAHEVPLAANFTAPYALWLADSRFGREAHLALLRRDSALRAPRVHLMQPYDPNRRVVVMLHGLGSSPAAWVNPVNEIVGDSALRQRYQVWQVFYPTNLPIPENRRLIRAALVATFESLDPSGTARASEHVTLVGHSMGGVIARLLLVESGDALWNAFFAEGSADTRRARYSMLEPYLDLKPLPQVDEAIFLAAPHRGAPVAGGWLGRVAAHVVRLPQATVETIGSVADAIAGETPLRAASLRGRRNSITNLSNRDEYLRATAELGVAPGVAFHSIIGRRDTDAPLAESSDGVVPYASSHLGGAASELVVASRHAVQDTPQAILEIRRILREKKEN
jgi:pimeloyl-ACP methyl ester carboxylesterase